MPVQHCGPLCPRTGLLAVPSVPLHQGCCNGGETAQCSAGTVGLPTLLHLPQLSAPIQQPFPVHFSAHSGTMHRTLLPPAFPKTL